MPTPKSRKANPQGAVRNRNVAETSANALEDGAEEHRLRSAEMDDDDGQRSAGREGAVRA